MDDVDDLTLEGQLSRLPPRIRKHYESQELKIRRRGPQPPPRAFSRAELAERRRQERIVEERSKKSRIPDDVEKALEALAKALASANKQAIKQAHEQVLEVIATPFTVSLEEAQTFWNAQPGSSVRQSELARIARRIEKSY